MKLNSMNVTFDNCGSATEVFQADARFAGSWVLFALYPGAYAPGFTLSSASRTKDFRLLRGLRIFVRFAEQNFYAERTIHGRGPSPRCQLRRLRR
jgi:hypothetical protein